MTRMLIVLAALLAGGCATTYPHQPSGDYAYAEGYVVDEVIYSEGGSYYIDGGYGYGSESYYGGLDYWYDPFWYLGYNVNYYYYGFLPSYYSPFHHYPYYQNHYWDNFYNRPHLAYYTPYDRYGYHRGNHHYGYHDRDDYDRHDGNHGHLYGNDRVQSRPSSRNEVLRITRQGRLNQSRSHANDSAALGYKSPAKERVRSTSSRLPITRTARNAPRVQTESADARTGRSRTSRNTLTTVRRGSATTATPRNRAANQAAAPVRSRPTVVRQTPQTARPSSDFRPLGSRNEPNRPVRTTTRSRPATPRATVSRSLPSASKPAPVRVDTTRLVTRSTAKPDRRAASSQPPRATKPPVSRGRSDSARSNAKPSSTSRSDRKPDSRKPDSRKPDSRKSKDRKGGDGRDRRGHDG